MTLQVAIYNTSNCRDDVLKIDYNGKEILLKRGEVFKQGFSHSDSLPVNISAEESGGAYMGSPRIEIKDP